MDDQRQSSQSPLSVDTPAATGSYYQPIGGNSAPAEPVAAAPVTPSPIAPSVASSASAASGIAPAVEPSKEPALSQMEVPAAKIPGGSPLNAPMSKPQIDFPNPTPNQASSFASSTSSALPPANNSPVVQSGNASASVVQKMQSANNTPPKKKIWLLLGAGLVVIVLLAVAVFAFSPQSGEKTINSIGNENVEEVEQPAEEPVIEEHVLTPPDLPAVTAMSGSVCPTGEGNLFFYNLDEKLVYMSPVNADAENYEKKLPAGSYVVFFQSNNGEERVGYTGENEENYLETIAVTEGNTASQIDVCNAEMDWRSVPIGSFGLGEYEE